MCLDMPATLRGFEKSGTARVHKLQSLNQRLAYPLPTPSNKILKIKMTKDEIRHKHIETIPRHTFPSIDHIYEQTRSAPTPRPKPHPSLPPPSHSTKRPITPTAKNPIPHPLHLLRRTFPCHQQILLFPITLPHLRCYICVATSPPSSSSKQISPPRLPHLAFPIHIP